MPKLSVRKCCSEMLSSKSLLKEPIFLQPSLRDKHTNTNTNTTTMTVTMTSTNILTVASSLSSCSLPFFWLYLFCFSGFLNSVSNEQYFLSRPYCIPPPCVALLFLAGWWHLVKNLFWSNQSVFYFSSESHFKNPTFFELSNSVPMP